MEQIEIMRLDSDAILPTRAHSNDAGLDLYGLENQTIEPGQGKMLRTGVAMAIADGFVGQVADRSSYARKGLKTAGGIIDAGYRGEVQIIMRNLTNAPIHLEKGDRIAQLLIVPISTPSVKEVTELSDTHRGEKGFGSSGR